MKKFLFFILISFILNQCVLSLENHLRSTSRINSVSLPLVGKKIVHQDEKPNKNVIYNQKDKSFSIQMRGDIVQILTNINVGGVTQEVIVDTGSVLLVVPSTLCNSCQQPLPHYHPSSKIEYMDCEASECREMGNACIEFKSNNKKVCGNQVRYLQSTEIITILVQDTFSFANDTGEVLATFGSIVSNRGRSLEHGIIGLGKTCDGCRKSPVELIFEKTNILRTFSMWLDSNYQGTLLLGDIDPEFEKSILYTPMMTIEQSHYGVLLSSASIYDKISQSGIVITSKDFGEVIIDSGTSEALIDVRAYTKLKNFLQRDCKPGMCGSNSLLEGYCYNYPERYFNIFPTIHIEILGGAVLEVEPKSYITSSYVNGIRYRCFGIKPSPLRGKSIIGLSWLRNNYIVFDTEHNRMGFGKKKLGELNGTSESSSFDFSEFAREQEQQSESDQDDDDIEFSSSYADSDSKELKPRLNDDDKKKKYVVKISDEDLMIEDLELRLDEFNSMLINEDLTNKEAKQLLQSRKKLIEQINQMKLVQQQKNEQHQKDQLVKKEKEKIEEEQEEIVIQKQELKNEHINNNSNYNSNRKYHSKVNKNNHNKQQQGSNQHHHKHHQRLEFNEPKQIKLREWFNKKQGTVYSSIHKETFNDLLYSNGSSKTQQLCSIVDNEQVFNGINNNNNNNNNYNNNNNNNSNNSNNNNTNILITKKSNRENKLDTNGQHPIVLKYDPDTKRRKSNLPITINKINNNNNNNNNNKLQKRIVPYYKNTTNLSTFNNNNSNNKLSSKFSKLSGKLSNSCSFDFTQKKEFEWIDNYGKSFTFWESTIINLSATNSISKFILSTMDNVQYTVGMKISTTIIDQRITTIISLPSNQTISPNSSYRFIYISNSKDALSFSVGECNLTK